MKFRIFTYPESLIIVNFDFDARFKIEFFIFGKKNCFKSKRSFG